ncbi:MAG TPA: hypothetical protein VF146_04835 [Bryobacteraceae bacterium]
MFARLAWLAAVGAVCPLAAADASASAWKLTSTEHFQIYSQVDPVRAQRLLNWFEQLRGFFLDQHLVPVHDIATVRVIVFASAKDYAPFRLHESDAHYAGAESRQYIAMADGENDLRVAAHELAHVALSNQIHGARWLSEGLAEFFSTVRMKEGEAELGGGLPAHIRTLRQANWTPLSQLLSAPVPSDRADAMLFYGESWALADMLLRSPGYSPDFQKFLSMIETGSTAEHAFASVYGKSAGELERDLHAWLAMRSAKTIRLSMLSAPIPPGKVSDVPEFDATLLLAELLASGGELSRAEALLQSLEPTAPNAPEIPAALGQIALRKGDREAARIQWKRAIDAGAKDADVCYQYALLADGAGLPGGEIRAALQRALAIRPTFDDARYKLALLEKNAGNYEAAVAHLLAMGSVKPARAFSYWMALADAYNEMDRRDEAIAAARRAKQHAGTADERRLASQVAYIAQTDVAVQFSRDSSGRAQMVTTRVPHESAGDWNPFVESGDDLRSVSGLLREIDCGADATRIEVEAGGRRLVLVISDPSRVRMRNAPEEFVCGHQDRIAVQVQYAALQNAGSDGFVRGIDFLP